jgi:hypothetical protein
MPNGSVLKGHVMAVLAVSLLISATPAGASDRARPQTESGSVGAQLVVDWNRLLVTSLRTPGFQPATVHPTYPLALMSLAIDESVNAVHHTHRPYLLAPSTRFANASPAAAATSAAHQILTSLYPQQHAPFDALLDSSLTTVPDGPSKEQGVRLGRAVADLVLAARQGDGSDTAPSPYEVRHEPGSYQLVPATLKAPVFTHWAAVTPFVLRHAAQFQPDEFPELTSRSYTDALDEVRRLGDANSTERSADQTEIARFWSGPAQNYWNEIAQTVAVQQGLPLERAAELFAVLDLGIADGVIAFYDAKYHYNLWRPITAIQAADPSWQPLLPTPPDPSYPGAHSVISATAAGALRCVLGTNDISFTVTSPTLPGVTRNFASLTDAAREAGFSRTLGGVHFSFDDTAGQTLGHSIAKKACARLT